VHSLRDWLTRKQRETRRGRAELRLAERSAAWNARPENRHLPSWWEYLDIRLWTDKKKWTDAQRKMMVKAGRVHVLRAVLAASLLIGAGLIGISDFRFQISDCRLKGERRKPLIDAAGFSSLVS
jgi:hypothetical protein